LGADRPAPRARDKDPLTDAELRDLVQFPYRAPRVTCENVAST